MATILVVDDDHAVLRLVQSCLKYHGFRAITAASAAQAREALTVTGMKLSSY